MIKLFRTYIHDTRDWGYPAEVEDKTKRDILAVLKKDERGDSIIVRLFETEGKDGKTAIRFFRPVKEVGIRNQSHRRKGSKD